MSTNETSSVAPLADNATSSGVTSSARQQAPRSATRKRKTTSSANSVNATSKADTARQLFSRLSGKKTRKEIIDSFINEAGLTEAGARTYYQRFRQEGEAPSGRTRGKSATGRIKSPTGSNRTRGRPVDEHSKAGVARAIFKKLSGKKPRKEIIEAFQKEAHLTPAGSSTYYQKFKNAA